MKITRPAEDFHRLVPDSATNPTKWKLYFYLQSTTSSCANLTATQQTKTRLQFWEFGPDSGDVSDLITAVAATTVPAPLCSTRIGTLGAHLGLEGTRTSGLVGS